MQYKTIIHRLLQHQYPALHEQLKASRTLLPALDRYATELKSRHVHWTAKYQQANPDRHPAEIASIALETAVEEMQEDLRCDSPPSATATDVFSLDAAMAYLRRHTPSA